MSGWVVLATDCKISAIFASGEIFSLTLVVDKNCHRLIVRLAKSFSSDQDLIGGSYWADCWIIIVCSNCDCLAILTVFLNSESDFYFAWCNSIAIKGLNLDQTTFLIFEEPVSREERFYNRVSGRVLVHVNLCLCSLTILCNPEASYSY